MDNKILHMPPKPGDVAHEPTYELGLGGYDLVRLPKELPGVLEYFRAIGTFALNTAKEIRDAVAKILGTQQSKSEPPAKIINLPKDPDKPAKPDKLKAAA